MVFHFVLILFCHEFMIVLFGTNGGTNGREHLKNMLKSIKMRVPTNSLHTHLFCQIPLC
jgi:hypothetical protein